MIERNTGARIERIIAVGYAGRGEDIEAESDSD